MRGAQLPPELAPSEILLVRAEDHSLDAVREPDLQDRGLRGGIELGVRDLVRRNEPLEAGEKPGRERVSVVEALHLADEREQLRDIRGIQTPHRPSIRRSTYCNKVGLGGQILPSRASSTVGEGTCAHDLFR
jgi:hypothetical protein